MFYIEYTTTRYFYDYEVDLGDRLIKLNIESPLLLEILETH
jgi:hypothetical protein